MYIAQGRRKHRRVLPLTRGCFDGVARTDRQLLRRLVGGMSSNLKLEREEWRKKKREPKLEMPPTSGIAVDKGKAPCSGTFERRGERAEWGGHRSGHSPFSFENPFMCLFEPPGSIAWAFNPPTTRTYSPRCCTYRSVNVSSAPGRILRRFPGCESHRGCASGVCS